MSLWERQSATLGQVPLKEVKKGQHTLRDTDRSAWGNRNEHETTKGLDHEKGPTGEVGTENSSQKDPPEKLCSLTMGSITENVISRCRGRDSLRLMLDQGQRVHLTLLPVMHACVHTHASTN